MTTDPTPTTTPGTLRRKFAWDCQVQDHTGNVTTERVEAYWAPDHALTAESVRLAARCQVSDRQPRNAPFPAHASDPELVTA